MKEQQIIGQQIIEQHITLSSAEQMTMLGQKIAAKLQGGELIFLRGELGAGKTTLARGIIQGLGHNGHVKSPTFTLVEPYPQLKLPLYHFDLYRLTDPQDLEDMGWRDYLAQKAVMIVEWPQKAEAYLPAADLDIVLEYVSAETRVVHLRCTTA